MNINDVVNQYRKSTIQSEAEVRSKLIVPLLESLGYPPENRAEEFPVHGYSGRDKLPSKSADFILFDRADFSIYRKNTQANNRWVEEHSLLIVEAKKPGKMIEDLGQARFYTMWTKAVAYMETDGERIIAYFLNQKGPDYQLLNLSIADIPASEELTRLSYKNLLNVKKAGKTIISASEEKLLKFITLDEELELPEAAIEYARNALGKNAIGLSNIQVISRFINFTGSILENDLRYGIPPYMIDFPRNEYSAKLYINGSVLPYDTGKVITFYQEEEERFLFESKMLQVLAFYKNNKLTDFELGYRIWHTRVSERLKGFDFVEKFYYADSVTIIIEDEKLRRIELPIGTSKGMWITKEENAIKFNFWFDGMKKLKEIEEYYEIEFKLGVVQGLDQLNDLYDAIDFVYDGIMLRENCTITLPGDILDEKLVLEEPILFQENVKIALQPRVIHNYTFIPYRSALLPGEYEFSAKKKNKLVKMVGCVEYAVEEEK